MFIFLYLELAMNDTTMEDVGFGAGEGLDFLDDFGEVQDIQVEDWDQQAPLDETLKNDKDKEREELEAADRSVAEAVAELTGEKDVELPQQKEQEENDEEETVEQDATVPEQPTGI